jgi:hypothetical protein
MNVKIVPSDQFIKYFRRFLVSYTSFENHWDILPNIIVVPFSRCVVSPHSNYSGTNYLTYSFQWFWFQVFLGVDGNKSLYLVFVGVIFSQYLGLLSGQLGQHLRLLLEQLGQQHLGCFFRTAGQ